jgi:hypothetical protein
MKVEAEEGAVDRLSFLLESYELHDQLAAPEAADSNN